MTTSPSRSATGAGRPGAGAAPPAAGRAAAGRGLRRRPPAGRLTAHEVSVDGAPVELTPTEFRLLAALVRHPGQVLTPDQLLELAWSDPFGVGPDRVKYSVMRLRRKLGQGAGEPGSPIEAVRGFGYKYVPPG